MTRKHFVFPPTISIPRCCGFAWLIDSNLIVVCQICACLSRVGILILCEQLRDVLFDNACSAAPRFWDILCIPTKRHLRVGMPKRCRDPKNVLPRANHRCGKCMPRVIDAAVGDVAFKQRSMPFCTMLLLSW